MDRANQSNFDAPAGRRSRGRPRKNPILNHGENSLVPHRNPGLNHGVNSRVPPTGYDRRNGNQSRPTGLVDDANGVVVGQVVSAVVEAVFDAGFLLSVMVGDSGTTYSGVVFKPGRYVPISAENDVAPQVQMIRRNNIFRPKENQAMVQYNSINRNGTGPASKQTPRRAPRAANGSTAKRKRVPPMAIQPVQPMPSRGTVVPVVLQPVDLSNGIPPVTHIEPQVNPTQAPAHMAASRAVKLVPIANRVRPSPPQTSPCLMDKGLQSEKGFIGQPSTGSLHEEGEKSTRLTSETLRGEEVNRSQFPFQSIKAENDELPHTISTKSSSGAPEVPYANHPLLIKPLQSIQPDPHKEVIFVDSENGGGTDEMQEL